MCEDKHRRQQQPAEMKFCPNCVSMITRRKEKNRFSRLKDFKRKVNFLSVRLTLLFTSAQETDCGCVDLETECVIPAAGSRATGRQDKVEAAWWESRTRSLPFVKAVNQQATQRSSLPVIKSVMVPVPEVWWPGLVSACCYVVAWSHARRLYRAVSCCRWRL